MGLVSNIILYKKRETNNIGMFASMSNEMENLQFAPQKIWQEYLLTRDTRVPLIDITTLMLCVQRALNKRALGFFPDSLSLFYYGFLF